jgi:hypothetical protein
MVTGLQSWDGLSYEYNENKHLQHQEQRTNACSQHSLSAVFSSSRNAAWFTLLKTSCDVTSLAPYHSDFIILLSRGACNVMYEHTMFSLLKQAAHN